MAKNNAKMIDVNAFIQAGIDPKTGLPIKAMNGCACNLKGDIKKNLRIMDEQNAVNCFTWYNLPSGISAHLLERILYYKGQGMFFYMEDINKFLFLPYALNGTIDVYGRFTSVTPLPFNGTTKADEKEEPWIQGLTRECVYEVELPENYIDENGQPAIDKILAAQNNKCVLLHDYTQQISQTNISRQILNDPILDVMSEMIPFARTALLNGTGVNGMKVSSEDEAANVELASQAINTAALSGKKWVPFVGNSVEFQSFADGPVAKAEEYFLALQSLDNLRLSFYGLDNGGLFQKKSHMLEAEQEMNTGNVGLIMRDRLQNRQDFCTLVNSIWGLGIWCEISETVIGMDKDGDMVAGDNEDRSSNMGGDSKQEDNNNDVQ